MVDTTELYTWIPVHVAVGRGVLSSSQGCGKSSACVVILLKSCLKQTFVTVGYVADMTVKQPCMYGKYGSFEHVLFL